MGGNFTCNIWMVWFFFSRLVSNVLCLLVMTSANWNWAELFLRIQAAKHNGNLDGWAQQGIFLSLTNFGMCNWDSSVKWESFVMHPVVMLCAVPHAALLVFPKPCFNNRRIQQILRRHPLLSCIRWPGQSLQKMFPKCYHRYVVAIAIMPCKCVKSCCDFL